MPAVGLSTGRSLACASVKKSLVSMEAVSMVASGRADLSRLDGRSQHHHIGLDMRLLVRQQVAGLYQELAVGAGHDLAHLTLDVMYAVFLHRAAVEFVVVLAGVRTSM